MATSEDYNERLELLFCTAADLAPPDRARFLAEHCHDAPALRRDIESLITYDDPSDDSSKFSSNDHLVEALLSNQNHDPRALAPAGFAAGSQIGRYRIVRLIAEGGMGVVLQAIQDRPRRTVALKLIRPGLVSPTTLKRFAHEIHLLGRLQHSGIAQIFESGVADTGIGEQPYFAMEFISGRTLIEFATDQDLDTRSRLRLVIDLCDAVQHAHQKGIIHRDLKPANVLVTEAGQPKVLDFGVARAIDAPGQLATAHTHRGQLIGTLPYMSPEQLDGDPVSIDVRSDVYALGVLGFELVSGRLPFDPKERSVPEIIRAIREDTPNLLGTGDPKLNRDLQTIIAKALEKVPDNRYQSAADFAADLRRFLDDRPIVARHPSLLYHLHKYARRHRARVAGGAIVLLSLIGGAGMSIWQAVRATRARDQARIAEYRMSMEADAAKTSARKAERISRFLRELLSSANPKRTGQGVTVREVLQIASRRMEKELSGDPELAAVMHATIGDTYISVGDPAGAELHLRAAWELQRASRPVYDANVVCTLVNLVTVLRLRGKYDQAAEMLREAIAGAREHRQAESELDELLFARAGVAKDQGDLSTAEESLLESLTMRRGVAGELPVSVAPALEELSDVQCLQGRYAAAVGSLREALSIRRAAQGTRAFDTAWTQVLLGEVLRQQASPVSLAEAESLTRDSLEICLETAGAESLDYAVIQSHLARILARQGRIAEAEQLFETATKLARRVMGSDHYEVAKRLESFARFRIEQGQPAEAVALLREALDIRTRTFGMDHPATQCSLGMLNSILEAADPPPG